MRETFTAPLHPAPEGGGLADLIYRNAAEAPDDVALRRKVGGRWVPVTAADFRTQVTDLARGLIASGIEPGDRVGLLASTRYEWTLLDFALWAAGAIPVPIYVTSSVEQIHWILSDSEARAVIVETAAHEETVTGMRGALPELRRIWRIDGDDAPGAVRALAAEGTTVDPAQVEARRRAVMPGDIATIIYTSGTTGRPKGCVLTHANFFAEAENAVELLRPLFHGDEAESEASTLLFLPLAHVFGRMVQIGAIQAKATLGHTAEVKTVVDDLAVFRPTFILSVPYVLEKIYNTAQQKAHTSGKGRIFDAATRTAIAYSEAATPSLVLRVKHTVFEKLVYTKVRAALGGRCRHAISGGAALGSRLTHFYRGIGLTVFEGYGLTETTAAATINSLDSFRPGTVGKPLPGVAVKIDADGEVLIKGGPVFPGYWRNDDATAQTFTEGWFPTGDLGSLDEDGFLRLPGRKKEILVTSGGKNVAPVVIEDRITAHPLIGQAMVVGDGRKYITALVTIDAGYFSHWKSTAGKPAAATVIDLLGDEGLHAEIQSAIDDGNAAVSAAERVRRFRILPAEFTTDTGHLTPSLKLKRDVIMNDFADDIEALYNVRP